MCNIVGVTMIVLGNFAARIFPCLEILPRGKLVAGNFCRVEISPGGIFADPNFCRAEFSHRVIFIFISVINNVSFVFSRENDIENSFNTLNNIDSLR